MCTLLRRHPTPSLQTPYKAQNYRHAWPSSTSTPPSLRIYLVSLTLAPRYKGIYPVKLREHNFLDPYKINFSKMALALTPRATLWFVQNYQTWGVFKRGNYQGFLSKRSSGSQILEKSMEYPTGSSNKHMAQVFKEKRIRSWWLWIIWPVVQKDLTCSEKNEVVSKLLPATSYSTKALYRQVLASKTLRDAIHQNSELPLLPQPQTTWFQVRFAF